MRSPIPHLRRSWFYLKAFFYPTNLKEALRLMVFVLVIAGIPPFRLTLNKAAAARLSNRVRFFHANCFIILCLFFYCYIRTIKLEVILTASYEESPLFRIIDIVMVTIALFAMCQVYLWPIWNKFSVVTVVHILVRVDEHLERLGIEPSHRQTVLFVVKRLFFNVTCYGIYIAASYKLMAIFKHEREMYAWLSYFAPQYTLSLILLKYMTITHCLRVRLESLSKVSFVFSFI